MVSFTMNIFKVSVIWFLFYVSRASVIRKDSTTSIQPSTTISVSEPIKTTTLFLNTTENEEETIVPGTTTQRIEDLLHYNEPSDSKVTLYRNLDEEVNSSDDRSEKFPLFEDHVIFSTLFKKYNNGLLSSLINKEGEKSKSLLTTLKKYADEIANEKKFLDSLIQSYDTSQSNEEYIENDYNEKSGDHLHKTLEEDQSSNTEEKNCNIKNTENQALQLAERLYNYFMTEMRIKEESDEKNNYQVDNKSTLEVGEEYRTDKSTLKDVLEETSAETTKGGTNTEESVTKSSKEDLKDYTSEQTEKSFATFDTTNTPKELFNYSTTEMEIKDKDSHDNEKVATQITTPGVDYNSTTDFTVEGGLKEEDVTVENIPKKVLEEKLVKTQKDKELYNSKTTEKIVDITSKEDLNPKVKKCRHTNTSNRIVKVIRELFSNLTMELGIEGQNNKESKSQTTTTGVDYNPTENFTSVSTTEGEEVSEGGEEEKYNPENIEKIDKNHSGRDLNLGNFTTAVAIKEGNSQENENQTTQTTTITAVLKEDRLKDSSSAEKSTDKEIHSLENMAKVDKNHSGKDLTAVEIKGKNSQENENQVTQTTIAVLSKEDRLKDSRSSAENSKNKENHSPENMEKVDKNGSGKDLNLDGFTNDTQIKEENIQELKNQATMGADYNSTTDFSIVNKIEKKEATERDNFAELQNGQKISKCRNNNNIFMKNGVRSDIKKLKKAPFVTYNIAKISNQAFRLLGELFPTEVEVLEGNEKEENNQDKTIMYLTEKDPKISARASKDRHIPNFGNRRKIARNKNPIRNNIYRDEDLSSAENQGREDSSKEYIKPILKNISYDFTKINNEDNVRDDTNQKKTIPLTLINKWLSMYLNTNKKSVGSGNNEDTEEDTQFQQNKTAAKEDTLTLDMIDELLTELDKSEEEYLEEDPNELMEDTEENFSSTYVEPSSIVKSVINSKEFLDELVPNPALEMLADMFPTLWMGSRSFPLVGEPNQNYQGYKITSKPSTKGKSVNITQLNNLNTDNNEANSRFFVADMLAQGIGMPINFFAERLKQFIQTLLKRLLKSNLTLLSKVISRFVLVAIVAGIGAVPVFIGFFIIDVVINAISGIAFIFPTFATNFVAGILRNILTFILSRALSIVTYIDYVKVVAFVFRFIAKTFNQVVGRG